MAGPEQLTDTQQEALALLAENPDRARMSNQTTTRDGELLIHSRTADALQRMGLVTLVERGGDDGRRYTDVGLTDAGRRTVGR